MGTVYKETFTKPLPAGAKIIVRKGQPLAEWKPAKGKTRTAPLTAAGDRITVEAGTYTLLSALLPSTFFELSGLWRGQR